VTESIETRVKAAIGRSQGLDPGGLTATTTFEDLGMTSLDALALVNDLEEELGIAIPNEEAMALLTVGQVVDVVRRLSPPEADAAGPAGSAARP
jgi:acyl carrier protein